MAISSYIRDDLAVRLQSGDTRLELTLDALAEHYRVSLTPVRTAVAELIETGVLAKGPNRRLTASTRGGGRRRALRRPPQPVDPFDVISRDLVRLSLQGEPIDLREEATAEKYGIGRSAVRNIFHRLAGIGIVDHEPRCGWRLRPFRQEDMQAFLEVREVLELKALDLARPRLVDGDLRLMSAGNVLPKSADERPRIDNTLHAYLIDKAGNAYIRDFFQRHGRYYELLFDWEGQDRATSCETVQQHRRILNALLKKNWSAARRALSHHIRDNHPILRRIAPPRSAVTVGKQARTARKPA